jgi:hypothetical protein
MTATCRHPSAVVVEWLLLPSILIYSCVPHSWRHVSALTRNGMPYFKIYSTPFDTKFSGCEEKQEREGCKFPIMYSFHVLPTKKEQTLCRRLGLIPRKMFIWRGKCCVLAWRWNCVWYGHYMSVWCGHSTPCQYDVATPLQVSLMWPPHFVSVWRSHPMSVWCDHSTPCQSNVATPLRVSLMWPPHFMSVCCDHSTPCQSDVATPCQSRL